MFDVTILVELQKAYNEESNLKKKLKDSQNSVLELVKQYEITQKEYNASKELLHNLKAKLNDENLKLATEETSVKKFSNELYTTHQSNPKYLRDIELKIQDLNKQKSSEEETILLLMDEIENINGNFMTLEKLFLEISDSLALKKSAHRSLEKHTQTDLEMVAKRKEELRSQLEDDIIEIFDKEMLQCQGKAVAMLLDGTCSICRFQIPLTQLDNIKKNRNIIHFCSNCNRILIVN